MPLLFFRITHLSLYPDRVSFYTLHPQQTPFSSILSIDTFILTPSHSNTHNNIYFSAFMKVGVALREDKPRPLFECTLFSPRYTRLSFFFLFAQQPMLVQVFSLRLSLIWELS